MEISNELNKGCDHLMVDERYLHESKALEEGRYMRPLGWDEGECNLLRFVYLLEIERQKKKKNKETQMPRLRPANQNV